MLSFYRSVLHISNGQLLSFPALLHSPEKNIVGNSHQKLAYMLRGIELVKLDLQPSHILGGSQDFFVFFEEQVSDKQRTDM